MSSQPTESKSEFENIPVREHVFDGIQEYDNRLPNWWLWTLYGAIVFSIGYWFLLHWTNPDQSSQARIERQMQQIAAVAAANPNAKLTDEQLWKLSQDQNAVGAGAQIFASTCASCHMPDLSGKIGPNLKDNIWIHGGKPLDIVNTITNGVAAKGMPTWGPVLGKSKIAEVTAFILSHHKPDATGVAQ